MKKLFAVILALVVALSCCAVFADEAAETVECPEEAKFYEGKWRNVDADMEIYWEEQGFKVMISNPHGEGKETDWEYSCTVTEDNRLLALPFGLKKEVNGETIEQIYDDGEAEFFINDNNFLEWKNLKETLEIGNEFTKVSPGDFDGYWDSDNCVIEMWYEEEGYRILIREVDENANVKETEYSGYYHEDDNTVVTLFGEETFTKNEDGELVWNGIAFTRVDLPDDDDLADG